MATRTKAHRQPLMVRTGSLGTMLGSLVSALSTARSTFRLSRGLVPSALVEIECIFFVITVRRVLAFTALLGMIVGWNRRCEIESKRMAENGDFRVLYCSKPIVT